MRRILPVLLSMIVCVSTLRAQDAKPADQPVIDVVFAIDCSGSMGGVIETAKLKVWSIVNEIARAKPTPQLRIGLIGYGNGEGPFRMFPLTDDLDEVYKNLMTFKDEGWGSEFVGLAIQVATRDMKWTESKHAYKVLFVVGNETARQGPAEVDYSTTAPAAIAQGIVVNAIYCGTTDYDSATPTWREFARLADGQYMEIAAEGGAIAIATPFDQKLAAMSNGLNGTFVAFGKDRDAAGAKQAAQDANAQSVAPAAAAERANAKISPQYETGSRTWDLVSAIADPAFDLSKVPDDQLPEEMRKMTLDEKLAFLKSKAKAREEMARQIAELSKQRDAFIKAEVEKRGLSSDKSFDSAVQKAIVEQAQKRGFKFE